MNKNNYIEKLLDGVEVEWKKLGVVCDILTGGEAPNNCIKGANSTSELKYPIYGNGTDVYGYTDTYRVDRDAVTISSIGANTGAIYFRKAFFTPIIRLKVVIPKIEDLLPRFIYHYLTSITITSKSSSVPNMNANDVKKINIPIPPIKVQKEIVRILDTFTELTTELTTELAARKKQYTYYRDKLLTFDENEVEWKRIDEVSELVRGNGLPKSDFTDTGIPAIHYGQIYTYYGTYTNKTISFVSSETAKKLKKVNTGDIIITNTSENLDDVGKALVYLGEDQAVTGGHATIIRPTKELLNKYFAYYTQSSHFSKLKRRYAKGTKVIDVSATDMAKIIIPIPSLETQEKIVSILDKFDTLTTSISEGLPREIELRQKQYEYYRDMLLSFPKEVL